jgi:hypothetical protein
MESSSTSDVRYSALKDKFSLETNPRWSPDRFPSTYLNQNESTSSSITALTGAKQSNHLYQDEQDDLCCINSTNLIKEKSYIEIVIKDEINNNDLTSNNLKNRNNIQINKNNKNRIQNKGKM